MNTTLDLPDRTIAARQILDSLRDLEYLHREIIDEIKSLLESLDQPPLGLDM